MLSRRAGYGRVAVVLGALGAQDREREREREGERERERETTNISVRYSSLERKGAVTADTSS